MSLKKAASNAEKIAFCCLLYLSSFLSLYKAPGVKVGYNVRHNLLKAETIEYFYCAVRGFHPTARNVNFFVTYLNQYLLCCQVFPPDSMGTS